MDDSPEEGVTNLRNLESLKAKSDFFFCEVALPGLRHRGKPDPERGLAPCHFNHESRLSFYWTVQWPKSLLCTLCKCVFFEWRVLFLQGNERLVKKPLRSLRSSCHEQTFPNNSSRGSWKRNQHRRRFTCVFLLSKTWKEWIFRRIEAIIVLCWSCLISSLIVWIGWLVAVKCLTIHQSRGL